jgi:hypothetical protein
MCISGESSPEDVPVSHEWCISRAETRDTVRFVLSLSFWHGLGHVHGRPTRNTDILNESGTIQIADFYSTDQSRYCACLC